MSSPLCWQRRFNHHCIILTRLAVTLSCPCPHFTLITPAGWITAIAALIDLDTRRSMTARSAGTIRRATSTSTTSSALASSHGALPLVSPACSSFPLPSPRACFRARAAISLFDSS